MLPEPVPKMPKMQELLWLMQPVLMSLVSGLVASGAGFGVGVGFGSGFGSGVGVGFGFGVGAVSSVTVSVTGFDVTEPL